jgi:tetratricopeptide (TPR) repeat protein
MAEFDKALNYGTDVIMNYDKNAVDDLDYINLKEKIIKEKIKNTNYDYDEQRRMIDPLFDPNPFISQQIDYGEKNQIRHTEFDPYINFLNEKGLNGKNVKVRYNVEYVNIDSINRNQLPYNITSNNYKLINNPLSIINNTLQIQIDQNIINNLNVVDKFTLTNISSISNKYLAFGDLSYDNQIYNNNNVIIQQPLLIKFFKDKNYAQISINPNFAEAHSNRGNALTGLERFTEALESCDKAVIIKPDYAKAHNNLGITLQELGRLDEAVASCSKAVAINPDLADVHNNLGSMLQKLGRLDDAVASYSKAIVIKPDLAEAHINLGFTLQELGRLDDATASLSQALLVKADYASFKSATSVTALLPFGRSGSLFLHSLLDGHPDIATLPGVYFKGWFGINCWQYFAPDITRSDWRERLVAKVIDKFIPLFNANNRQNVPGKPFSNTPWLAKSSGFMEMGSERSQPFVVDQNAFAATLLTMLNTHHSIDIKGCFELIHRAFEVAIRNNTGKASQLDGNIFYHIHNPDLFESAHFFHHYPQARLLYLMRHPIQSLESWMLTDYPVGRDAVTSDTSNDFNDKVWLSSWDGMVNKAVNMFMQVRLNANCWPNSRGVKLEDVKRDAKKVMPQLAEWMGVADHPALYESSFCGLQYWGPSARETGNITGFDTKAIDLFRLVLT